MDCLEREGMYQAGGNVCWVNAVPDGVRARSSASVADLLSIIDRLWLRSSAVDLAASARAFGGRSGARERAFGHGRSAPFGLRVRVRSHTRPRSEPTVVPVRLGS